MQASADAEPQSFRALIRRHPNLRLLFISQLASLSGTQISRVVIPTLAVLVAHVSAAQLAAIVVAEYLPVILGAPVIGLMSDRLPTRALLVSCDVLRAAALIAFVIYTSHERPTFLGLLLLSLVIAVASALFDVSAAMVVPTLFDDGRRVVATAGLASSQYATQIIGPTIGGFVVQLIGTTCGLIVDAASYLFSFALLGKLSSSPRQPPPVRTGTGREMFRGFAVIRADTFLQRLIVGMALLNLGGSGVGVVFVLYLYRDLKFAPAAVGISFALNGIGLVLGSRAGSRLIARYRETTVIRGASGLCAVAVILIPLASRGWSLACIFSYQLAFGFGASLWSLSLSTSLQRVVPLNVLGRVNATVRAVVMSTLPLGALAAAGLATRFGVLAAIEILVACIVISPICYASRRFGTGALADDPMTARA